MLTLSISLNIYSQNKEISLDPVAVSATLSPSAVSKSGRNIVVISAAEIEKMPASSLDEVLRYLPGMEVQSRGPMGAQADFSLRGATFQQVLVILDGVRINDPLTGHFSNYIPIAPSEIERIEILKGASSALYGADAVGGVINIISKSFQAGASGKFQQASAEVGRGEYNLYKDRAGISWQNKGTVLSAGYFQNKTDGQLLRGTRSFLDMNTISVSAKQSFSENTSLSYRFARDYRDFNAQNFYTAGIKDTATERVITEWHQASFRHQHGKHLIRLDGALKNVSDKYQYNRTFSPNTNYSNIAQAQLTHQLQLNEKSILISGMQWINRKVESSNRGNHRINYGGIFTVLNHQLGENLLLSPALRLDYNERSGMEILPLLNFSWRNERFQLRGSAGRSTREADFTERFNNFLPPVSGTRIGNPDLKPESSWNFETGTDFFLSETLRLSGTAFGRFHKNLIDYQNTAFADMPRQDYLNSGTTYLLAKNLSRVQTLGLESDVWFRTEFKSSHLLDASIGLVLMNSTTEGKIPSQYVSNHAKFLGNFNLIYSLHNFSLSANGVYKIRQVPVPVAGLVNLSPDYFMLNLRAECRLFENSLVLFFQADNVLDKKYADILGPQMPGRWLSGGIRVAFKR